MHRSYHGTFTAAQPRVHSRVVRPSHAGGPRALSPPPSLLYLEALSDLRLDAAAS